jgi:hypothetical protein
MPELVPKLKSIVTGVGGWNALNLIAVADDDLAYLMWQDHASGTWHWYGTLPQKPIGFSRLATGIGNRDNLQVICIGDGTPHLIYQGHDESRWYWREQPLPQTTHIRLVACATGIGDNNNLQVVCLSEDGRPYLMFQYRSDGSWHPDPPRLLPHDASVRFTSMAVGNGNKNNMQVVCLSTDGRPFLIYQERAERQWYWRKDPLPHDSSLRFKSTATGAGNGNNLQVICISTDGKPYLIWQDNSPGSQNGQWKWGGALPHGPAEVSFTSVATGIGNEGCLQVVCLADGKPYLIWQENATGRWHWGGALPTSETMGKSVFFRCGVRELCRGTEPGLRHKCQQRRRRRPL